MKIKCCRSCKSLNINKVFDLGSQKLSEFFQKLKIKLNFLQVVYQWFFVILVICYNLKTFDPNVMYGDNYGYMSSLNSSMMKHLYNKAISLKKLINLSKGDLILDIGSNDGSFLGFFSKDYIRIGIDPTIKNLGNYIKKK